MRRRGSTRVSWHEMDRWTDEVDLRRGVLACSCTGGPQAHSPTGDETGMLSRYGIDRTILQSPTLRANGIRIRMSAELSCLDRPHTGPQALCPVTPV